MSGFPYRRIVLVTGHDNGRVRACMAQALQVLCRDVDVVYRRVRGNLTGDDLLVVVDVRFICHKDLEIWKAQIGCRYIEVRAGSGGIAQQVLERLHLRP